MGGGVRVPLRPLVVLVFMRIGSLALLSSGDPSTCHRCRFRLIQLEEPPLARDAGASEPRPALRQDSLRTVESVSVRDDYTPRCQMINVPSKFILKMAARTSSEVAGTWLVVMTTVPTNAASVRRCE